MPISVAERINTHVQSSIEELSADIGRLAIVDIGRCLTFDGRFAEVLSNKFENGRRIVYSHVEILAFGNVNGAQGFSPSGQSLVFVFSPRVPVPIIQEDSVRGYWYSAEGMKGFFVSDGISSIINSGITSTGAHFISGPKYSIKATETGVAISASNGTMMAINGNGTFLFSTSSGRVAASSYPDGKVMIEHRNDSNITIMLKELYPDGTEVIKRISAEEVIGHGDDNTKWGIIETHSPDGSTNTKYYDGDEVVREIDIDSKGQIKETLGDSKLSLEVDTDGNVSISSKGDANITFKDNVTLKADKIKFEGDVEITGDLKVGGSIKNNSMEAK